MTLNLTNSIDIVANSISIINDDGTVSDVLDSVTGNLTIGHIQNIETLSTALNDDPTFSKLLLMD